MKYDFVHRWVSPLTGAARKIDLDLPENYILIGDKRGKSIKSAAFIDAKLDIINLRRNIDAIASSSFILQTSNPWLPKAQSIDKLGAGLLKTVAKGVLEIAELDVDYVSYPTFRTEINKRVIGPDVLLMANTVPVFDYINQTNNGTPNGIIERKIKGSAVTITNGKDLKANTLAVASTPASKATGFMPPYNLLNKDIMYIMPENDPVNISMLCNYGTLHPTRPNQLFWVRTSIGDLGPSDPDDPSIPIPPIIPVFPVAPPIGAIPVVTPGGGLGGGSGISVGTGTDGQPRISMKDKVDFEDDVNFDGDANFDGDLSSIGDISTEGSVRANSIDTNSIRLEDTSLFSDNFVEMVAPEDLLSNYSIEMPDSPRSDFSGFSDEGMLYFSVNEPALPQNLSSAVNPDTTPLPVAKLSFAGFNVESPLIKTVEVNPVTNQKQITISLDSIATGEVTENDAADFVWTTLHNSHVTNGGTTAFSPLFYFDIRNNYYSGSSLASETGISITNRYNNGYILKQVIDPTNASELQLTSIQNSNQTEIFKYKSNKFQFNTTVSGLEPSSVNDFVTKGYLEGYLSNQNFGGLSSVSGTIGQINSTGGKDPVLSLATTNVTAGSYTLPNITVDSFGRITSIANSSSGVTAGSYTLPNITVDSFGRVTSIANSSSGVTAGSYTLPNITVDSFGRITSIANGTPQTTGNFTFDEYQMTTIDGKSMDFYVSPSNTIRMFNSVSIAKNKELRFITNNTNNIYLGITAPASLASSLVWKLPGAPTMTGQVLTTDGVDTMNWSKLVINGAAISTTDASERIVFNPAKKSVSFVQSISIISDNNVGYIGVAQADRSAVIQALNNDDRPNIHALFFTIENGVKKYVHLSKTTSVINNNITSINIESQDIIQF